MRSDGGQHKIWPSANWPEWFVNDYGQYGQHIDDKVSCLAIWPDKYWTLADVATVHDKVCRVCRISFMIESNQQKKTNKQTKQQKQQKHFFF